MQPSEIEGVKRVVQEKLPEGVNERGLTVTGFLFLHALFIEKGRLETTWTVLRKFGYNNEIRLADELLPPSLFKRTPDQVNCSVFFVFIGFCSHLPLDELYIYFFFSNFNSNRMWMRICFIAIFLQ